MIIEIHSADIVKRVIKQQKDGGKISYRQVAYAIIDEQASQGKPLKRCGSPPGFEKGWDWKIALEAERLAVKHIYHKRDGNRNFTFRRKISLT